MGKIYYVMGKSSSGKDTVYRELLKRHPAFQTVISYTTRPMREGEADGREYFFVDKGSLRTMKDRGRIIEMRSYDTRCGIWTYFTADDGQIDLDRYDYLLIGTLVSYRALKKYFGEEKLVPVYIEVEDGLRLSRALERERCQEEPKYAEMCRRFLADEEDFSEKKIKEAGIGSRFDNTCLEQCIEEIERYMGV